MGMTTSHTEPPVMSPPQRRRSWPLVLACVVVVVAAVVVTLVLTSGDTGSGTEGAAPTSTATAADKADSEYDLSTPEAAADSFLAAAKSGSGDLLVSLACVGRPACVREHAADLGEAQLVEAQNVVREGVFELAVHLEGAEFSPAVDGTAAGAKDVPYRTPEMTGDDHLALTFVKSDGDWLYYSPVA